jgi:hypothetical protein
MKHFRTEYNPHKDAWEKYYWDDANEVLTIKNTFQIGSILEANKAAANASIDTRFGNKMLHHVAEIPNGVITKLMKEHNVDVFSSDPEQQMRLRRLLDDPDYRYLKTTVKRLHRPTSKVTTA